MEEISQFAFATAGVLIVLYLVFVQRLFHAAKKFDPPYFEELGSPHIIMNNKPKHSIILLKALFSRSYKKSVSPEVVRAGNTVYVLFWLTLCSYGWLIYVI